MTKIIALTTSCLFTLMASTAVAEDHGGLFIFKKNGEMPQVEASGVDRFGASAVHDLLGEDYVVFHGARAALSSTSPLPVQPIEPDGIPDDDPLPLCQCPEDYTAGLTQRFGTPKMLELLRQERTVITPSALPNLEVDQIQALEQMIRNKGPLILQGQ